MRVHIPCDSQMSIGGGFTFKESFSRGSRDIQIVQSHEEPDIVLVLGASTLTQETIDSLKNIGGKIVLRVDGFPEDWRNSGKGISKLVTTYHIADAVIYQSLFSYEFVGQFLKQIHGDKKQAIIYNGVNTDVFNTLKKNDERDADRVIISTFYRKDPNKRYEEIIYRYRQLWLSDKNVSLWIIGRIPTMYQEYKGGFFNHERVRFCGVVTDDQYKAYILQGGDEFWYPSFADPCPNALIEALFCGLEPKFISDFGGSKELVKIFNDSPDELTRQTMMLRYYQFFSSLL